MTSQERKLWNVIKNKQFYGYKFLRQYIIGEYIADFVCREEKIIIEIDDGQHNQDENIEYDKKRTEFLENLGYRVVRFWNNDIDNDMEGIYQKLQDVFGIKTAAIFLTIHSVLFAYFKTSFESAFFLKIRWKPVRNFLAT